MKTMKLRLTVSASYDLSEVPEEYLEDVRKELRARLTDMPQFYAGQGDFTGDTEATLDEWDSVLEENPPDVPPGALAALVAAAEDILTQATRTDAGQWVTADKLKDYTATVLRAALAPFPTDPAPPAPERKPYGYAWKTEHGYLARQGRETWHESEPVGWALFSDPDHARGTGEPTGIPGEVVPVYRD